MKQTSTKVDNKIEEKDGVRNAVEHNPPCTEIFIEEWYRYGQDYKIGYEQY